MKRKIGALLALAFAAVSFAPSASAQGHYYYGHPHRYYHGYHHGDAVAAGVVGLALGAALGATLSDGHYGYYNGGYYSGGYYGGCYHCSYRYDGYAGGYYPGFYHAPRLCITREHHWDPYLQRDVIIEERHYC